MSKFTNNQLDDLNLKYGYFEFGDAQGDKTKAFANDLILKYESMRDAAPDMYDALVSLRDHMALLKGDDYELVEMADKALAKADGKGE